MSRFGPTSAENNYVRKKANVCTCSTTLCEARWWAILYICNSRNVCSAYYRFLIPYISQRSERSAEHCSSPETDRNVNEGWNYRLELSW